MKYIVRTNNINLYLKNNFTLFTSPRSIIHIMLKKIILPLILLIFTQQDFYGMEENDKEKEKKEINNETIFDENHILWSV